VHQGIIRRSLLAGEQPRAWLINEVRLWTKRSGMRWRDCRSWDVRLFTGTKCIVNQPAASKIASVASFLDPRTEGLTKYGLAGAVSALPPETCAPNDERCRSPSLR
jgi:hypothetical protein